MLIYFIPKSLLATATTDIINISNNINIITPTNKINSTISVTSTIYPISTNEPEVRYNNQNSSYSGTLLDGFNSTSGWTSINNPSNVSLIINSTNYVQGNTSLQLIINGTKSGVIQKTVNVNLSNVSNFYFWFFTPKNESIAEIQVYLSNGANYSNYFGYGLWQAGDGGIVDGWNNFVIAKSSFVAHGTPNWNNIKSIRFRIDTTTNNKTTVNLDNLRINYNGGIPKKAVVMLTFDNGYLGEYLNASPILESNQITANVYPVLTDIGYPAYMNVSQMKELYDSGWDISSQTVSHMLLPGNSLSEINYQLSASKSALSANGFTRSDKFIVYPYGVYNNTILNLTKNNGYLMAFAVGSNPTIQPNLYVDNPSNLTYTINRFDVENDITPSEVSNIINKDISEKGLLVLEFHDIIKTSSPSSTLKQYQYSTADFAQIISYLKQKQATGQLEITNASTYYMMINRTGNSTK